MVVGDRVKFATDGQTVFTGVVHDMTLSGMVIVELDEKHQGFVTPDFAQDGPFPFVRYICSHIDSQEVVHVR